MPTTATGKSRKEAPVAAGIDYPRRITVPVTEEMHRQVRIEAATRGITVIEIVRDALARANLGRKT
jgi:hypothetical protein